MAQGFVQQPVLSVPTGVDADRYSLCLLGPLALGLSVGIQVTMTGFLLLGSGDDPALAGQLTEFGSKVTRPEHDLLIYIAGAAFTLFMFLMLVVVFMVMWAFTRKVSRAIVEYAVFLTPPTLTF